MTKIFAAVALVTLVVSPALAQSYDPSVGSGNIVQQAPAFSGGHGALASEHRRLYNDLSGRPVHPFVTPQDWWVDTAKGNIW